MKTVLKIESKARSVVWLEDGFIFKRQRKFLCDNEMYFLEKLAPYNFTPRAERLDVETIRLEYIAPTPITRPKMFLACTAGILNALEQELIRHGDLTIYAVIPHFNRPYLIDFAEARIWNDPRPDKRPEGDLYWLTKTLKEYVNGTDCPHPYRPQQKSG